MSNLPSMTPIDEVSETNLLCAGCGYNLTGITIGSTCPECGLAVGQSIQNVQPLTTSGAATGSLVCGILGIVVCGILGPVAIILYFVAQKDIRAGTVTGSSKGLALAGLILGIISTVLTFGVLAIVGYAETFGRQG